MPPATRLSLKSLARRILDLNDEIADLDRLIGPLVGEPAPNLLQLEAAHNGAGSLAERDTGVRDLKESVAC